MDKKNKKITYMIIGIATLLISVIGATFAYFTATANNNNTIAGNMATVNFDLSVAKKTNVDEAKGGLIPMTNSMVESAVNDTNNKGICVDDNNNAVCQIYKITINNIGSASMFVDGYVTLTGGSGTPTDYVTSPTTMRWSQVFCTESNNNLSSCTTAGSPTVRQTNSISWNALGTGTGHDTTEIKDSYNDIKTTGTISGNNYDVINTNYIRVSKHTGNTYSQTDDVTSALVFNQLLNPDDNNSNNNTGDSNGTYADSQVYYIVVWLSENGHNQTAGSGGVNVPNSGDNFFQGNVVFNSSEGSEVTATFSGYTKVGDEGESTPKFTGTIYRNSTEVLTIGSSIVPVNGTKYVITDGTQEAPVEPYETQSECQTALVGFGSPAGFSCQQKTGTFGGITEYSTSVASMNKIYYLKHKIVNDIATESYVEFVVTPEMASSNSEMTAGTYTLRGAGATSNGSGGYNNDSPYYTANVNVLKRAFGENSGYCGDFTSSSYVSCRVSGLHTNVFSDGDVNAGAVSAHCYVTPVGDSGCGS